MNARTARMIRETTVSASGTIAAVIVVIAASAMTPDAPAPAQVAVVLPPIDANAVEGNVVDLTY
jgi:hypothetical protein